MKMPESHRKPNGMGMVPIFAVVLGLLGRLVVSLECPAGNGVWTSVSSGVVDGKNARFISTSGRYPYYSPACPSQ